MRAEQGGPCVNGVGVEAGEAGLSFNAFLIGSAENMAWEEDIKQRVNLATFCICSRGRWRRGWWYIRGAIKVVGVPESSECLVIVL